MLQTAAQIPAAERWATARRRIQRRRRWCGWRRRERRWKVCLTARTQCQCPVWSADSDDSRNPWIDVGLDDSSSKRQLLPMLNVHNVDQQHVRNCPVVIWDLSNNWIIAARFNGRISDSSQSMSPVSRLVGEWRVTCPFEPGARMPPE